MLTIKDYCKYPFLKGAANALKVIPELQKPIIKVIDTEFGKSSLTITKERLSNALYNQKNYQMHINNPLETIASFFFARALLSLSSQPNKSLIDKFATYETNRFYSYYKQESLLKKKEIQDDLQITDGKTQFSLKEYIPLSLKLIQSSSRWKLVNMPIHNGIIDISDLSHGKFDKSGEEPKTILFKEQIKHKIKSTLPMTLDKETKSALEPVALEIFGKFYTSMDNTDYGEVTSSNFPPCIQHIIDMIQKHENPTHMGRFAMVSFLNEIGMPETEITSIFQTVRDFDLSQTIYQVEHISGKQGSPAYKCPACDTMLTNGLCLGKDNQLCKKVKHPLGYYKAKHKFTLQKTLETK